jgi:hypothetical protein
VHVAAVLSSPPASQQISTRLDYSNGAGAAAGEVSDLAWSLAEAPALARMVGARRLRDSGNAEAATQLALRYQLVTEHTNLLLVAERAADDKAEGLPQPHQVPQMLAAGWHNTQPVRTASMSRSRVLYSLQSSVSHVSACSFISAAPETPRYLRRHAIPDMLGTEPGALLHILDDVAMQYTDLEDASTRFMNCGLPSEIMQVIQRLADQLQNHTFAWAVFMDWLSVALQGDISISRHSKRLLNASMQGLDDETRDEIRAALKRLLPSVSPDAWGTLSDEDDSFQLDVLLSRQRY